MDFALSPTAIKLRDELLGFMDECVYPAEADLPHGDPQVLEDLKAEARRRGLWNLFFPGRLSNVDYAPLAEVMGRSLLAPEACNCAAPDTANMELLALFGTDEQKARWLEPLLDGEIRSAFAMTEPAVASSDATNISCRIERQGGDYVVNGRKWWISGAASPRCEVFIVMGKTDPDAVAYNQQSMILVPVATAGVTVVRNLPVFGYTDREGHCEVLFDNVRVPAAHLLGPVGAGFLMAQARLGPGRVHHCMRTIGVAERALELMCRRVRDRVAFGKPLADQGVIQQWIADARIEIDQARLYTLHAAWLMDSEGNRAARHAVSGIKVAVPNMALRVIDHAIQAHGAAGIGDDFPLAWMYAHVRALRLADGPDEVHRGVVARNELRKWAN
ncbi:MAG: acyl-CoA dehydrogenase [Acidimicrobiaceae bacterium]|jgi:acyl-CoA dehydrogenase|nr:acyl-CoA dehydrogenase [Acidimicrobiaceae bacterium]MDQ1401580.1 acyl-CoA dehydrogenase [Acidimicrobiaceae bacterium]